MGNHTEGLLLDRHADTRKPRNVLESDPPREGYWVTRSQVLSGIRSVSSAVMLVASISLLVFSYDFAWHVPWFEQRVLPTIAVAHGQSIYHMPGSGPLIGCTYAPLSYLAFLPVAALGNVWAIFAAGSVMATCFLLLPVYLALRHLVRTRGLEQRDGRFLLLFAFVGMMFLRPLNYVASIASADSPAICLMALSLLILYWDLDRPRWATAALSSLALVASVGCKQNMLIAAVVVLIIAFYFFGRNFAGRYLAFSALWIFLLMGAAVAIYGDLHVIYFNNVVIPSHIPVEKKNLFFGSYQVCEYGAALGVFLIGMVALRFLSPPEVAEFKTGPRQFPLAFFAVAAAMIPVSIRTYAVVGGDVNSFSHAVYFLLLGTILVCADLIVSTGSEGKMAIVLELWMITSGLLLLASGMPTQFNWQRIAIMGRPLPAVEAYKFDQQHPGEVYFPSNSVATYLAEGKFYETDWGVLNLAVAGQQLRREDIFRNLPSGAKYLAVPKGFLPLYFLTPLIAPHLVPANLPGLENFSVYILER